MRVTMFSLPLKRRLASMPVSASGSWRRALQRDAHLVGPVDIVGVPVTRPSANAASASSSCPADGADGVERRRSS